MRLTLLLPILFLTACFADDRAEPVEVWEISDETKSYISFAEGSWWVYKNTQTGDTNRVKITHNKNTNTFFESWDNTSKRHYNVSYNKLFLVSYDTRGESVFIKSFPEGTDAAYIERSSSLGVKGEISFFQPLILGMNFIHNDSVSTILKEYKIREEINGKVFSNVLVFSCLRKFYTSDSITTDYHYAPNVGLIKRELVDSGYSWELIDYAVEQ